MAIAVVTPAVEVPEHTTLSRFVLNRLDDPSLEIFFTETKDGWQDVRVLGGEDCDEDGLFETVILAQSTPGAAPVAAGRKLYDANKTLLATITAVEPAVPTVENPLPAGTNAVRASLDTPLASAAPRGVLMPYINGFGNRAHVNIRDGRNYALTLRSTVPAERARMQQALVEIHVEAVLTVLGALGITGASQADVTGAIIALAGQGVNIESMIASALERIELDRRAGTFQPLTSGQAPLPAAA